VMACAKEDFALSTIASNSFMFKPAFE
jgi:hypothetical protein